MKDHRKVIPCGPLALPYRTYMAPKSIEGLYYSLDRRGLLRHPLIMPALKHPQAHNHIAVRFERLDRSRSPDHER